MYIRSDQNLTEIYSVISAKKYAECRISPLRFHYMMHFVEILHTVRIFRSDPWVARDIAGSGAVVAAALWEKKGGMHCK
jgi:hypothetical protein